MTLRFTFGDSSITACRRSQYWSGHEADHYHVELTIKELGSKTATSAFTLECRWDVRDTVRDTIEHKKVVKQVSNCWHWEVRSSSAWPKESLIIAMLKIISDFEHFYGRPEDEDLVGFTKSDWSGSKRTSRRRKVGLSWWDGMREGEGGGSRWYGSIYWREGPQDSRPLHSGGVRESSMHYTRWSRTCWASCQWLRMWASR